VSCFPESVYSVYADGELAPDMLKRVEGHLVECQPCRALVVMLQDESSLLRDLLLERDPAIARLSPGGSPVRGIAIGFGPAVALALAMAAVLGAALEAVVPSSLGWADPMRLIGVPRMVLDTIFLIRDEMPAVIELAVAFAAMAGLSALLSLVATALFRHFAGSQTLRLLTLTGLALFLAGGEARAHFGMHDHDEVLQIDAGDVHDGTVVFSGQSASVDGIVDGDLIVLAEELEVRGEVKGNVYAGVERLVISGRVTGSVHTFADNVQISGRISTNFYGIVDDFTLESRGSIARDSWLLASTDVDGKIGRDLYAAGDRIVVRGEVSRSVYATGPRIEILAGAKVGGNLEAKLPRGRDLMISPAATIRGEVESSVYQREGRTFDRYLRAGFYFWWIVHLLGALLTGTLIYAILPALFSSHVETGGKFARALGVGLVVLIGGPIALVLLAMSVIGLPLALLGFAFYLSAWYLAAILFAGCVGRSIVPSRGPNLRDFALSLLAGLAVVTIGINLPYVGGVVWAIVVLTGLGLLVERIHTGITQPAS